MDIRLSIRTTHPQERTPRCCGWPSWPGRQGEIFLWDFRPDGETIGPSQRYRSSTGTGYQPAQILAYDPTTDNMLATMLSSSARLMCWQRDNL